MNTKKMLLAPTTTRRAPDGPQKGSTQPSSFRGRDPSAGHSNPSSEHFSGKKGCQLSGLALANAATKEFRSFPSDTWILRGPVVRLYSGRPSVGHTGSSGGNIRQWIDGEVKRCTKLLRGADCAS